MLPVPRYAHPFRVETLERGKIGTLPRVNWWEPTYVFFITFIVFALITPRFLTYLDPVTDAERGALLEYQHRRAAQRRQDLNLDPTRPF